MKASNIIEHKALGDLRILLSGVPCISNRGYFGYCTVVLFPLDGGWALFDTGHYSDRSLLFESLKAANVRPEEIHHVVLSHLHFDHVLNLPIFKNASVTLTQAELDYARQVSAGQVEDPSIPDFWPILLENREVRSFEKSVTIGETIEILHMPGHTPGCLVMFYKGPSTIAICGDVIKNAWEAMTGEASMSCGDPLQVRESMNNVLQKADLIIPGHDRPFMVREGGVEFLAAFQWEVHGNIFPKEPDGLILDMNIPPGFYPNPGDSMERVKSIGLGKMGKG